MYWKSEGVENEKGGIRLVIKINVLKIRTKCGIHCLLALANIYDTEIYPYEQIYPYAFRVSPESSDEGKYTFTDRTVQD
ncbi:Hypothetical predicted protein [Octopus vulgaris]|uniref:Uncharacterized protein n=1 Tax=Octopus vulgaris TaxID=6645 RepID=A0AA36BPG0_OCTVU|nr:Hypothetical predicted protein [Octopus vulgaris]